LRRKLTSLNVALDKEILDIDECSWEGKILASGHDGFFQEPRGIAHKRIVKYMWAPMSSGVYRPLQVLRKTAGKKVAFLFAMSILLFLSLSFHVAVCRIEVPLIKTKWGQAGLYASKTPIIEGNHASLGCWSTAIGQIINFHYLRPFGKVRYVCSNRIVIINDLDAHTYNWSRMAVALTNLSPKEEVEVVSTLLFDVATIIKKDFGTDRYLHSPREMTIALQQYFRCNSEIVLMCERSTRIKDYIIQELDAEQPCVLYIPDTRTTPDHAFVIDGWKRDSDSFLVHINMGREGEEDGWYDFDKPICKYDDPKYRAILSIRPTSPIRKKVLDASKAMEEANASIKRAAVEGRTQGIDMARALLTDASKAFNMEDYDHAKAFAKRAKEAADAAIYPQSYYEATSLLEKIAGLKTRVLASNFTSTEAQALVQQALASLDAAEKLFSRKEFAAATEYAKTALSLFEKALSAEQSRVERLEASRRQNEMLSYALAVSASLALGGFVIVCVFWKEKVSFQGILKKAHQLEEALVEAKAQKAAFEVKVKELETEKRRLLAEKALKSMVPTIQQVEKEMLDLAARKAELEEKTKALETERDQLKKEIQELEEKMAITELEARITGLHTEVGELREKKKQLEERLHPPEAAPTPTQEAEAQP